MLEPRPLYNIAHPQIDSIYLKKDFDGKGRQRGQDVLVIQTKEGLFRDAGEGGPLFSVLADLDLIRDEVIAKAGETFSRIDIRCPWTPSCHAHAHSTTTDKSEKRRNHHDHEPENRQRPVRHRHPVVGAGAAAPVRRT
jgi:hypothetical protein